MKVEIELKELRELGDDRCFPTVRSYLELNIRVLNRQGWVCEKKQRCEIPEFESTFRYMVGMAVREIEKEVEKTTISKNPIKDTPT